MRKQALALALTLPLAASCTVVEVQSRDHPKGLRADGLVDGHLVFGWNGETKPFRLDLFDGRSPGAIGELVIWKLFRIEIGAAGLALGVGPVDVALGTLFYDPCLPPEPVHVHKPKPASKTEPATEPQAPADPQAPAAKAAEPVKPNA